MNKKKITSHPRQKSKIARRQRQKYTSTTWYTLSESLFRNYRLSLWGEKLMPFLCSLWQIYGSTTRAIFFLSLFRYVYALSAKRRALLSLVAMCSFFFSLRSRVDLNVGTKTSLKHGIDFSLSLSFPIHVWRCKLKLLTSPMHFTLYYVWIKITLSLSITYGNIHPIFELSVEITPIFQHIARYHYASLLVMTSWHLIHFSVNLGQYHNHN